MQGLLLAPCIIVSVVLTALGKLVFPSLSLLVVYVSLLLSIGCCCLVLVSTRRGSKSSQTYDKTGDTARLIFVGSREQLLEHGALTDVSFEPIITRVPLAERLPRSVKLIAAVLALALVIGTTLIMDSWHLGSTGGTLLPTAALAVVLIPVVLTMQTYFRIVPGRLDVMTFVDFIFCRRSIRRFDLKSERIIFNSRHNVLCIGECEFSIALVWQQTRLAHALFLAAVSTHSPAPLPDDEFLG